jgi:phosphatidylglycerol---prolipoprotein diacylglyceryl transferase
MNSAMLLAIEIGINPTIFEVAGLEITWHGLFTAIGVLAGVGVAYWFARRAGYPEDMIYNVALAVVIGGIVGARALFVIENWGEFKDSLLDIFAINTGGISIWGGLIGGLMALIIYSRIQKIPNFPHAADIGAIGAIVGMAVGRIGDIINGEHFSRFTSLPWGVVYTHPDSPSYLRFGPAAEPQHPAVAYEMLGDLVIFLVLLVVYFQVRRAGVTFFSWVLMYGVLRFFVSFLREDEGMLALGLSVPQGIALAAIPVAIAGIIYLLRTPPAEDRASRAERRRTLRDEPAADEPPAAEEPAG